VEGEFALTLDQVQMTEKGGITTYDCSREKLPDMSCEKLPASFKRIQCLRKAMAEHNGQVRVIRVKLRQNEAGVYKIIGQTFDQCYWKVESVDVQRARFVATRTSERARTFSLNATA